MSIRVSECLSSLLATGIILLGYYVIVKLSDMGPNITIKKNKKKL